MPLIAINAFAALKKLVLMKVFGQDYFFTFALGFQLCSLLRLPISLSLGIFFLLDDFLPLSISHANLVDNEVRVLAPLLHGSLERVVVLFCSQQSLVQQHEDRCTLIVILSG
jgi:hypothetical protein